MNPGDKAWLHSASAPEVRVEAIILDPPVNLVAHFRRVSAPKWGGEFLVPLDRLKPRE